MMRGVAHGVEVLHRRGIIHADISPRNLLVCDSRDGPTCKLVDFGFVHLGDPSVTASLVHGHGTPRFVAPEVLAGEAPSARSDVFSLGRVLELALELAMETHPSAPRLTDQQGKQHRLLREIIVAATDSNTDKRLASASVLAEQLSAWLEFGKSTEPSLPMDRYVYRQQAAARSRAKRLATLLAVGLVACIVSGGIALVQRQNALHAARAESSARARANAVLGQSLARALATSPQVNMSSGISDDAKAVVNELSDMLKTPSQLNQTDRKAIRTAAIQLAGETGQYELARSWQLEELAAIAANEQGTPAHISLLRTLGQTEHMLGHADEAERYLSQAIVLGENAGTSLSDELGMSLCALADLNRELNDLEAARGLVDRAMMLPKSCKFLVWGMTTRAQVLRDMDSPDALAAFDKAMAAMQDCSLDVQKLRYSRAILLTDLYADPAKLSEALRETESLASAFLMTFGDKDAQTARVLGLRARALRLASRLDEAFAVAEKAVEVARSAVPYELEAHANALKALAASQLSHGIALVNEGDGLQGRKLLDQAAISAEAGVAILPDVELYREQRAELHEFAGLARHRAGSYSLAEDHLRKAFLLRNPEDTAKPVAGTPQKLRTSRRLLADAIFAGNPDRAAEARDLLTPIIHEAVTDPDQGGRANFAPLYVKILEHLLPPANNLDA
jgi:tetratricopeptide (TPR) repeat protein